MAEIGERVLGQDLIASNMLFERCNTSEIDLCYLDSAKADIVGRGG